MSFDLTPHLVRTSQLLSVAAAATSFVCCTLVLLTSAWVWTVRTARPYLDRVSFRLLLSCLVWEIIYDINYVAVVLGAKPNKGCTVGIYFMMGTMGVVNYLCTCIAVNLFVTIVLGLNPIRMGLERWYIGVSIFVGLFVPLIPAALGHFGWDPIFHVCWIRAEEHNRITYFVLDLYLWQLLCCAIATLAVAVTLWKLFRQGRATSRALFGGDSLNFDMSSDEMDDQKTQSRRPRLFRGRRNSIKRERMFGHLEDRFVSIAVRVSMYPITLVVVNGVIAIGDLYISYIGGVKTRAAYGLYVTYYLFYGIRGVTFAALAAFVDPCLRKGLRAVWAEKFPSRTPIEDGKGMSWSLPEPVGCVAPLASAIDPLSADPTPVDLTALSLPGAPPAAASGSRVSRESIESDGSMDVMQALFASEPPADMHNRNHMRAPAYRDAEKGHHRHGFHPHLPHFHPHMPHLHLPNMKHLPWFLRRHIEKEAEAAQADADAVHAANVAAALSAAATIPASPIVPASPAATPASFNGFTGVPADAMPAWLADGADDVVSPEALAAAQAAEANCVDAANAHALEEALTRVETEDKKRLSTDKRRSTEVKRATAGERPSPPPAAVLAGLGQGVAAIMGPSIGIGIPAPQRRGSQASSHFSGSSIPSARPSFSTHGGTGGATPMRGSVRGARPRWAHGVGPGRRSSVAEPRTPIAGLHDPRARREATLALAEKLYEEMEAQL